MTSGLVFQMEASSTHCMAKEPWLKQRAPCETGRRLAQGLSSSRQLQMEGDPTPQTHTSRVFCIYAGEIKVLFDLAIMTEQALIMLQEHHTVLCIPWSLLLLPNPRGREFAPPGAVLQTSCGSCLSGKIRAAQPHWGLQGEVFPVRDRITPLDTHSLFLWPSCPRSS